MIETFRGALGRSVVAGTTAENVGSIKNFVLDSGARRVERLHISGHRKNAKFLLWSAVRSFGPDAVVAAEAPPESIDTSERPGAHMIGSRVLTTTGFDVGKVTDVHFDTTDGSVVSVETDAGPIEALRLRSIGSYALVVSP